MQRKRPPLPPKENMKRINTIGQSGGRSWEQEPWSLHWKLASYFQTGVNHWCNHCSNPTGPINMIPRCYSVRSRRPTEDPLPFRSCLNGDLAHTGSLLCCPVFFHFILLCFLLCYLIFFLTSSCSVASTLFLIYRVSSMQDQALFSMPFLFWFLAFEVLSKESFERCSPTSLTESRWLVFQSRDWNECRINTQIRDVIYGVERIH